ncbi:integrative genetic element Gsu32, integrase, putative [marine gamma proteobacterium HTCC2143]|uniref:Integrative genetic element Gsu32, integrase, putative n=1 Tax=marine gamma proteobacterium HTCC2143 TaxID=247633 RepID=A0YCY6_9GAMM|nr:integrative genetic element Gsu32, integrase, putative [marine gamma proteobacterium HTCC2143]
MAGGNSTPLNASIVKRHKTGTLVDTHPNRGLRLVARDTGKKTWIYRYKSDSGTTKQIRLGHFPAMSLADARSELGVLKELRNSGTDPRESAAKKKEQRRLDAIVDTGPFTFDKMVDVYLSERVDKQRKPKGAAETRRLLERDLAPIAKIPVENTDLLQIHTLVAKIHSRAPDVARVFRRELKASWEYAMNVGRTKSPCLINADTGAKMKQGKRVRALNKAEVGELLNWMPMNYSQTVTDALILTLYLGLRSGEVCLMHDRELISEGHVLWLNIPGSRMKTGKAHRVPIVGKALKVVERRRGSGYLFRSRSGGAIKQKVLGVEVYSHSGRSSSKNYENNSICPVSNWAPNDLRKTARTLLASMECPFEVGESILAHALPGVAGVYNLHTYDQEKVRWLGMLGDRLDRLSENTTVGAI